MIVNKPAVSMDKFGKVQTWLDDAPFKTLEG
jgi:hypothetical protein